MAELRQHVLPKVMDIEEALKSNHDPKLIRILGSIVEYVREQRQQLHTLAENFTKLVDMMNDLHLVMGQAAKNIDALKKAAGVVQSIEGDEE